MEKKLAVLTALCLSAMLLIGAYSIMSGTGQDAPGEGYRLCATLSESEEFDLVVVDRFFSAEESDMAESFAYSTDYVKIGEFVLCE